MLWREAWGLMLKGHDVKLPSWGGFWRFNKEKEIIEMHCKEGVVIDIRNTDRVFYTYNNIASDKWMLATPENTPILGGVAYFGFDEAIGYINRGLELTCVDTMIEDVMFIKKNGDRIFICNYKEDGIAVVVKEWNITNIDILSDKWSFFKKDVKEIV